MLHLALLAPILGAPVGSVELLNSQIKEEGLSWVAGDYGPDFEPGLGLLDGPADSVGGAHEVRSYEPMDLPAAFDSRDRWPKYVHAVRNQGRCGSCWAFSTSETLSDRLAIASNGSIDVVLSPEDFIACDKTDFGCHGGSLAHSFAYLVKTGIVTDSCMPYTERLVPRPPPACNATPATCTDGNDPKLYQMAKTFQLKDSAADIQQEIYRNGPVSAGFDVYADFMQYKSGVYQKTAAARKRGRHAVKITGWGVSPDAASGKEIPYWWVQNSWNTTWGIDGFFKILRGSDECGFEAYVWGGEPLLD